MSSTYYVEESEVGHCELGGVPYKFYLYDDEDPDSEPHFHIRPSMSNSPTDDICIRLDAPEYYGTPPRILNVFESLDLMDELKRVVDKDHDISFWNLMVLSWNDLYHDSDRTTKSLCRPDYSKLPYS